MDTSSFHKEPFTWRDYLRAVITGIITALLAFYLQKSISENRSLFTLISNSLLAGAAILLSSGALSYVKKEGFFDVSIVGFKQMFYTLDRTFSGDREMRNIPNVHDYRQEMIPKRRVNLPFLIVGLVFLSLAIFSAFFA